MGCEKLYIIIVFLKLAIINPIFRDKNLSSEEEEEIIYST